MQRHAVDVDMFAQQVAGGAGDVGDDRRLAAGQRVEQAGLAGVRAAGDHHRHTVAQQCALPGRALHLGQVRADGFQLAQHVAIGEEIDLLLGKVDGGLHIDAQLDQLLAQLVHAPREFTLQRAQGIARRLGRAGLDQVGDGLGLRQVQLVVKEGALAELARSRLPRAQGQAAVQQQIEHHRPAMPLQFQHILAGERMRAGEEQQDALVQHLALGVAPGTVMGVARARRAAAQRLGDRQGQRPGNPHDADAPTTLGGGDGGDGVTAVHGTFLHKAKRPENGAFAGFGGWRRLTWPRPRSAG